MSNVYENCPVFESDRYLLRFVDEADAADLLKVYCDKNALPFFNSDNCDGDNFYYPSREKMEKAIAFWLQSYKTGWFVRWTIIDKTISKAIGSIEMFHRHADDDFDDVGVLRLDLRSDYEKAEVIRDLLKIFVSPAYDLFDCKEIITKVPLYAIERQKAAEECGFSKTARLLIGTHDRYAYNGYYAKKLDD
jgi:RimJ/RimL family protein N-acetyltransferase